MNATATGRLARLGKHLLPSPLPTSALSPATHQLHMETRTRQPPGTAADASPIVEQQLWEAKETALIVCDMWDLRNHTLQATRRLPVVYRSPLTHCLWFYRPLPERHPSWCAIFLDFLLGFLLR